MHDWKIRKEEKKRKGSHTPGKIKAETCQADYKKKHMAKCSRSYKHQDFATYSQWVRTVNKSGGR